MTRCGKDFVSCLYFYERYHQDVALTSVIDDDDIIQKKLLDICMILENVYENKGYMAINFFKNESLIMELKEKYLVAKK